MRRIWADRQFNVLLGINILVFVAAFLLAGRSFVDPYNLQSMAAQVPEIGLLALGVMLAMVSGNGGIDLSGIALANLSAVTATLLVRPWVSADQAPVLFSLTFAAAALLVGLIGGMLNGFLIGRTGLTPIIATLGTQLFFTGIAVALTNGSAITLGYIEPLDNFGNSSIFGVPECFALFAAIALVLGAVLRFSAFGVRLYLLGTNPKAARYAGIAQTRILFVTYTLCGLLASVAGVTISARTSSAKWDYGSSYVLIAILIAVMAGVRPQGGYGRVVCVVLSAVALQVFASLFNFLSISNFFRDMAWGLLLLLFLASSQVDPRIWLARQRA